MTDRIPENELWSAVLLQAIRDATSSPNATNNDELRENARAWLLRKSLGLALVCQAAGLDYERVHIGCQQLAAAGWPAPGPRRRYAEKVAA